MVDAHRRRNDSLDREKVLIKDNPADFPAGSPVAVITETIDARQQEIIERDAELSAALGDKAQAMEIKEHNRDVVLELGGEIVLGARAIGDTAVPGITAKFKMVHPRTEQNIIADADAKYADTAAPLEEKFVTIAGLDAKFRQNLQTARNAFQGSRDGADSAFEHHAEAVGALTALFREVMELKRQRGAMVKLKYRNNPGKLAAWKIASHVERAPQQKDNAPDQPTT